LDGEGVTGVEQTSFGNDEMMLSTITNHIDRWRLSRPSNAGALDLNSWPYKFVPGSRIWQTWAVDYTGNSMIDGGSTGGTGTLKSHGNGVVLGIDREITEDLLIGVSASQVSSSFNVADRATTGTVDGTDGSMYVVQRLGSLYFSGIAGVDTFNNKEQRYVEIPGSSAPLIPVDGYAENLQGKFSSQSANGKLEVGWDQDYGRIRVTPFADLQFDALKMNAFTEEGQNGGSSALGLNYKERTVNSMPIFLGTQADAQIIKKDKISLIGSLRLAWKHETEPCRSIDADFIAAPDDDFVIDGVTAPRNALRIDTGLSLELNDKLSLFANFGGEYFSGERTNQGTGGVKYNW
jgi:uncharacterized protein with beta-barrel porin domain